MAGTELVERLDRLVTVVERLAEKVERLVEKELPLRWEDDVTIFERYSAFRWDARSARMAPVSHPHMVDFTNLVGIDLVKAELIRNTAQFVSGGSANNVLLWGERGTGKSSCVKALLQMFAPQGLRVIEVQRDALLSLPAITEQIRHVPFPFIIFCDDLSFAEGDSSYHELKTLLDGGIEARPENVLIYATSNRRHLMPEKMADNLDVEIHPEEAVSDKLSLADRFGLTLGFYPFNQDTYLAIVEHHVSERKIPMSDELRREALQWALRKGQRSGRAARQFVDDVAGRWLLENRGDN